MAGNRFIQPARIPGSNAAAPPVISGRYATGQTFTKGALLVHSSGELVECGADPVLVSGVALEAAGKHPGVGIAGGVTQVTGGAVQEVSYVPADERIIFSMRGKSAAGGDPLLPAQAHVGVSYGVAKVGNDWVLDIDEVTTLVFKVVDINIDERVFYCRFVAAALI